MHKTSKVISLKKKRIEKKYKRILERKENFIIFLGVPVIISSILTIDNYFVKSNLEKEGYIYNPHANVYLDYISNESSEDEYKDIKAYYRHKENIRSYIEELKKDIL